METREKHSEYQKPEESWPFSVFAFPPLLLGMEWMEALRRQFMPQALPAPGLWGFQPVCQPEMEKAESEDAYVFTLEVPGVNEENLTVELLEDGMLSIGGEKMPAPSASESECRKGIFQRTFRLPPDVDARGIRAALKQGVLAITCPRVKLARRIPLMRGEGFAEAA